MKVLLINPPADSPQPVMPLGLAYLAAALRNSNVSVGVIDAWVERLDFKKLAKRILDFGCPDLVGVTVSSPGYAEAVKTIRVIKEVSPGSKIVIGGTHPSSLPEECLRDNPEVDFVAVGEGDKLIVELAAGLADEQSDFSRIKGLLYREDGKIKNNGRAEPIKDLDALPFPARDLFPLFKYRTHPPYRLHNAYATLITSRGCPYQCTYCTKSVSGQDYRAQSAEQVVKEIEYLVNEYKIKQIHFYDDDFTINMKRVEDICDRMIAKNIKILWSCVTRVDLVNERLLSKMRRAGCWLIAYGVESGNQNILNNIKKGYKVETIREAFNLTKKSGIRVLGYFMAGLPGETYSTLNDTVELSLSLNPDFVSWSITALYPGSQLYGQAISGELGVSSLSPFAHGHTFIYEGDIPREYILKTVNQAYRKFYFRFGYIIRFFMKLQTLTEALSYLRTIINFFVWKIKNRFLS
ncbi:B12-binding domain-containing radical SAM protein [Candidatus Margulisiibacteriota bacterium]